MGVGRYLQFDEGMETDGNVVRPHTPHASMIHPPAQCTLGVGPTGQALLEGGGYAGAGQEAPCTDSPARLPTASHPYSRTEARSPGSVC